MTELRISFVRRTDRAGKTYFLAKPRLPVTIDLSRAALFVWDVEADAPSLTVMFEREREKQVQAAEVEVPAGVIDWDGQ